ncbi:LPD29 domain-containing protein [Aquibacillus saliphilus]|uniref:LPD29 domain-containing protein n=1 Tax=Aquibacillus saliphilus TaxID=1909422 RepID=UPI001CEFF09D|nr:LPD29 domain-containing protein [Aquibacillus saliphilus]
MSVSLQINEELNGIELYFDSKPEQTVLSSLKTNGFRWSKFKKCWYNKQSEKALKLADNLANGAIEEVKKSTVKHNNKTNINNLSLWDATQWTNEEVNNKQDTKQIAKEIRQNIKKRFPQCKFSVTSDYSHINVTVKQSPYNKDSKYLKAVKEYCNNLVNAYKVCYREGDPYTDLPSSHNFYFFNTSIDYDYIQTESTEKIEEDLKQFDIKLKEHEEAEEEIKEKEFQEYLKEQEKRDTEYKKQREEEKKQTEHIYNSVNVNSLEENNQYYIIGSEFANLNKNNTIEQYQEEVNKNDFMIENVKVTKEIHFNNQEALTNFSNMLLHDFDFLNDTGGSYTNDTRINSMIDFYNMVTEEKNTVQWNRIGVAIYFNNQLQFVVDTQGSNYSKYIGLTDNAIIKKSLNDKQVINELELNEYKHQANQLECISTDVIEELDIVNSWGNEGWTQYKETLKEKLKEHKFKLTKNIIQQLEIESLKVKMYKLLIEVDGIQEQFKDTNIKQGDKLTMFYISDFGSIVTSRITFDSVVNTTYAQYDNAVKLVFTPEKKRKLHYNYFHSTMLIYNGWYELPTNVLNEVEERNGFIVTSSKYHSCDNKQYDEILRHFEQQEIKPIVNTYKPTF